LLKHFNKDKPMNPKTLDYIEDYFNYKWNKNLNQAVDDP